MTPSPTAPKLTLFALPKPFRGHDAIIQDNAFASWARLPGTQVLIFGEDEGVEDSAQRFGFNHHSTVARNEYGTPRVDDLFRRAQSAAEGEVVAYVNADIILPPEFPLVVKTAAEHFTDLLMIGQRWDLDVTERIDFDDPNWRLHLTLRTLREGALHSQSGIDYFVFRRGFYQTIPPFAIGRMAWDNWFVLHARDRDAAIVDATEAVFAVHQNHGYAHIPGMKGDIWKTPETIQNRKLFGYPTGREGYIQNAATWRMTSSTLQPARKANPEALDTVAVPPWEDILEKATTLIEQGKAGECLALLDTVASAHGTLEEFNYLLAVAWTHQGDARKAEAAARKALRINPGSTPAQELLRHLGVDASTTWAPDRGPTKQNSDPAEEGSPRPFVEAEPPNPPGTGAPTPPSPSSPGPGAEMSKPDLPEPAPVDNLIGRMLLTDQDLADRRVLAIVDGALADCQLAHVAREVVVQPLSELLSAPIQAQGDAKPGPHGSSDLRSTIETESDSFDLIVGVGISLSTELPERFAATMIARLKSDGVLILSTRTTGRERLTLTSQLERHFRVEVEDMVELPRDEQLADLTAGKPFNHNVMTTRLDRPAGLLLRLAKPASNWELPRSVPPFAVESQIHPIEAAGLSDGSPTIAQTQATTQQGLNLLSENPRDALHHLQNAVDGMYTSIVTGR